MACRLRNNFDGFSTWLQQVKSQKDYEREIKDLKKQMEEQRLKMENRKDINPTPGLEPRSLKDAVSS